MHDDVRPTATRALRRGRRWQAWVLLGDRGPWFLVSGDHWTRRGAIRAARAFKQRIIQRYYGEAR
jgi:hypothetical protein